MLKFRISKQTLTKINISNVVADSRNYLKASFEFGEDWERVSPKVATFNRIDKENCCYSVFVENGECTVPWEVLQDKGTMEVSVQGGDLITTNPVTVSIGRSGYIDDAMQPESPSPSIYNRIIELSNNIESDWHSCKELISSYKNDIATAENVIDNKIKEAELYASEAAQKATELRDLVDNFSVTNDMIKDYSILPTKHKLYNEKVYPIVDSTEYITQTNDEISIGNLFVQVLQNGWTGGSQNVYVIIKVLCRHNNPNVLEVVHGFLSQYQYNKTQPDAVIQIVQQPGVVPSSEEYTKLTYKAVIKNINIQAMHRIGFKIKNAAATENGKIRIEIVGTECTVIPFDDEIDPEAIDYFIENNNNNDYVVVPLLWQKIKELKNAIISMGGDI